MSDEDSSGWVGASPTHRTIALLLLGLLLAAIVHGAVLDNEPDVSGDLALNATDGPAVTFVGLSSDTVNLSDAFDGASTVTLRSTAGNMTVAASSQTSLDIDRISGTWTNASSMSNSNVAVWLNPEDKRNVSVANASSFDYRAIALDDGTVDFTLATSAAANVTITNLNVGGLAAVNKSGAVVDQDPVANGEATIDIDQSDEQIFLQQTDQSTPGLDNPEPVGALQANPSSLSVDITDDDFPADEITVDFELNGTSIGSDTLQSDGTASTSIGSISGGSHTVVATATDDFGNSQTLSWDFSTANTLTVRNATGPDTIIDNRTVSATFFIDGNITRRSTDTGNISLDNIGGTENIIVSLNASDNVGATVTGFISRESLIIDYSEQTDVYLLPESATTRTVRFTINDRSGGQFTDNGEKVLVQRPINQSGWSDPRWETIFSDRFGPQGATAELEDGQRYRIIVRNDDGDERVLGSYSADADETVPLQVGQLQALPEGEGQEVAWNTTYNGTANPSVISFQYNDSMDDTDTIYLTIYEFDNESNVLAANQSFGGPHGNFSYTEQVPSDQDNVTWTVDVVVSRNDETIQIKEPVGPQSPILPDLPTRFVTILSLGTIIIVGGLFSQLNGAYGGLVMAALGGIFWFVDLLPPGTGIGVVILAMIVAAAMFIRERQVSGI